MRTSLQDLRFAFRMLVRAPGFAALAVITLALGIGANTAVFSIVNGVLLDPLPYPHPEQLVALHESKPNFPTGAISFPNFLDWQRENRSFARMAVYRWNSFLLTGRGEAEQVPAELITADFFRLLGVQPVLGRDFRPGEDRIGAPPIALVSAGFWQRKLGGRPDVIGTSLTLDGRSYTVVGVIPASFDLLMGGFQPKDLYVPIGTWNSRGLANRVAGLAIHGIGRLKPGVTLQEAKADIARVTQNLAAAYPDADKDVGGSLVPLEQEIVGRIRPFLLVLLAAVGFVLLITCANIGNLLLARATGRERELAVRAALGASRGRLVRQLLTENLLLSTLGGALGLLVAAWGTQAALTIVPTALPRADEIAVDGRVLLFTLGISMLTAVLFGLLPALRASRPALHATLKESGRGLSGARHRAQALLVAGELSLALVLLVGAGLMVRTLAHLWNVDPGFDPDHLLAFSVSLDPSMAGAAPETIRNAFRDIDARLGSVPGVKAVSLSWGAIPILSEDDQSFWLAGQPRPTSFFEMNMALSYVVEPQYLKAMGVRLLRGRFFTDQDDERAPGVAVIDDVFARTYFKGEDPIGRRINLTNSNRQVEIIGVVNHIKQWGLDSDDTQSLRAEMYESFRQMPDDVITVAASGANVMLRGDGAVESLIPALRRTLATADGHPVFYGPQTMTGALAESLAARRFSMILLTIFAVFALLLACLGVYGVIAYLVGQRSHELAIRVALGARPADVVGLVLKDGLRMIVAGLVLGLIASLALTRVLARVVYGVSPSDPLTLTAVALVLASVALAACYVPARRALKADPLAALREE